MGVQSSLPQNIVAISSYLDRRVGLLFARYLQFAVFSLLFYVSWPTKELVRKRGPRLSLAYATLPCGEADDDRFYFDSARVLTYQLLYDVTIRDERSIPVLVLVCTIYPEWQRERLRQDGQLS